MTEKEILKPYRRKLLLVMEEEKVDLINGKERKNIEAKVSNG
jgi:hypothetical protein